ncbi:uncharacterized protein DUF4157 [Pseudoduganella flava]|nr:DUF4157 domain-containing protein [Pseudoduganella flava]TWI50241.1 uncharacterized protein DUF4157 [Pseudoduganella flava]
MQKINAGARANGAAGSTPASTAGPLQRRCACGAHTWGGGQCAACAQGRAAGFLQASLGIGASDDPLEVEADRVAEHVVAGGRAPLSVQRHGGQPAPDASPVPASVDQAIGSAGTPLDAPLRQEMERRFGHDFSGVRVHTDALAARSARDVAAHAYTVGQRIVFGEHRYAPATRDGRRLLAHELTHVIQQSGAAPIAPRVQRQDKGPAVPPSSAPSSAPARLTYTKQTPVQHRCGDFAWRIKWGLQGAADQANGFIVQKVKQESLTQKCDGTSDHDFYLYWEAWQVKNGKIMSGISDRESLGDEFTWSNTSGTKGGTYVSGAAKFIQGYMEPFNWGRLPQAGPLPATTKEPPGWTEAGSKYRYVGVLDFFCCDGQYRQSKLTTEELDV